MDEKRLLKKIYKNILENYNELKETTEELGREGAGYTSEQLNYQQGYFAAYEEIMQEIESYI